MKDGARSIERSLPIYVTSPVTSVNVHYQHFRLYQPISIVTMLEAPVK